MSIFDGLPRMFLDMALSHFVSILQDKFLEVFKPAFKSMEDKIDEMMSSLNTIQSNTEMMMMSHCKAAYTYLSLSEFEQARNKFIDAEAVDPMAAVAKLWLGVLFYREHREDFAISLLTKALALNPFILQLLTNKQVNVFQDNFTAIEQNQSSTQIWKAQFDISAIRKPKLAWLDKNLFRITQKEKEESNNSCKNLIQISSGSKHAVAVWLNSAEGDLKVLSVLDIATGKTIWCLRLLPHERLLFSSPNLVIVESSRQHETTMITLFDIVTGKFIRKMTIDYFDTVLCPNSSLLPEIDVFCNSNCSLNQIEFYEKYMKSIHNWTDSSREWSETARDQFTITDPFGANKPQFFVCNTWHMNISYEEGYISSVGDFVVPSEWKYWVFCRDWAFNRVQ